MFENSLFPRFDMISIREDSNDCVFLPSRAGTETTPNYIWSTYTTRKSVLTELSLKSMSGLYVRVSFVANVGTMRLQGNDYRDTC